MGVTESINRKTELSFHRFTVEEYHKLGETNILHEDNRVELIEGRIVDMTPIGARHSSCVSRLIDLLSIKVHGKAILNVQNPVQLSERSEPEPDIMLLKYRKDFYSDRLPNAEDILLLIEVSETSLDYDKEIKIPLYANANIVEVWLVNLLENKAEVCLDPSPEGYKRITEYQNNQVISPKSFPDIHITVSEILGLSS